MPAPSRPLAGGCLTAPATSPTTKGPVSIAYDLLPGSLGDQTDLVRLKASEALGGPRRADLGQFMTPAPVAAMMAEMLALAGPSVRLLDAGAGVGSLTAAALDVCLRRTARPDAVHVDAWELDSGLAVHLAETLRLATQRAQSQGVSVTSTLYAGDFIEAAVARLDGALFQRGAPRYDAAILNPPYRKLRQDEEANQRLHRVGIDVPNLYAAFLALSAELLKPGGELVAIVPRSFCNGPYFRAFRHRLLSSLTLRRVHLFDRRDQAFRDDQVLQETVIFHAVKAPPDRTATVLITRSAGPDDPCPTQREAPLAEVVSPDDPDRVVHLVADDAGRATRDQIQSLKSGLPDLDVQVSTGRVVDFRVRDHLRAEPGADTVPLLYPQHLVEGRVVWPKTPSRKANALVVCPETLPLLLPRGAYVLIKRFSAKEERRRIVATCYDPDAMHAPQVAIENHLNVLHRKGAGLPLALARGLTAWLNTTLVDEYFRGWSGHTQVNASDLRGLPMPDAAALEALGAAVHAGAPQDRVDQAAERIVFAMGTPADLDSVAIKLRLGETLSVLEHLDLPREQRNERSALTLLALAGLGPSDAWRDVQAPLMGITPMMDFFKARYGKEYAPNTRETVRRFTVHQFVDAGLLRANPDDPKRATNSPKAVYQLEPDLVALLRTFGTSDWDAALARWQAVRPGLRAQYAKAESWCRYQSHCPTARP
jgi:adenine-specific DNA-methyltransferase